MRLIGILAAGAVSLAAASTAMAASVSFDGFNYSGTVTKYASLTDAQNGVNGTATAIATAINGANSTLPNARDGGFYGNTDTGEFIVQTLWWYSPDPATSTYGLGNPNNSNNGFVQLYDLDGSSVSSYNMGWSADRKQFNVQATGANATNADDFARLWPAPNPGGAASISAGNYLSYDFQMTASFANAAAVSGGDAATSERPVNIAGTFSGLFENTGSSPADNGFYTFDFVLGTGSAAEAGDWSYPGEGTFSQVASSDFIAPAPVPLPAGLPLIAVAMAGLGFVSRRARTRA